MLVKSVNLVLINCLRASVVRLTDHVDVNIAVHTGHKTTTTELGLLPLF